MVVPVPRAPSPAGDELVPLPPASSLPGSGLTSDAPSPSLSPGGDVLSSQSVCRRDTQS